MLVGCARVSTQDQDPALQLDALKGAGCEKVFTEKASGAQRERPQLRAALDYMRAGDTLVVWKLDRLARSLKQLIETVEDLGDRGIGLRSLTESIDTTTSGGKLIFHIFGALAEFERGVIRERTRAGLNAAKARGRLGGRPPALTAKDLAAAKALLRDSETPSKTSRAASASRRPLSTATCRRRGAPSWSPRHEPPPSPALHVPLFGGASGSDGDVDSRQRQFVGRTRPARRPGVSRPAVPQLRNPRQPP